MKLLQSCRNERNNKSDRVEITDVLLVNSEGLHRWYTGCSGNINRDRRTFQRSDSHKNPVDCCG